MNIVQPIQKVNIIRHLLQDDGTFPNNGLVPLLIYKNVLRLQGKDDNTIVVELLNGNNWGNEWVNGIFDYHHFHSITHEVLAIVKGSARVQFGGPSGVAILTEERDAVIIPAGVAHKAIDTYDDFTCIGAYPDGKDYDIRRENDNRETSIRNIRSVELPSHDPFYGVDGPLLSNWKK